MASRNTKEEQNTKKLFKCHICEMTFTQSEALNRHKVWHSEAKTYSCNQCGKQFVSEVDLNLHIRECRKQFASEGGLNLHIRGGFYWFWNWDLSALNHLELGI